LSICLRLLMQVLLCAALRDLRKLGTAMAASRPIRDTTIIISTRVNAEKLGRSFVFVAVIRCAESAFCAVLKQFAVVRNAPAVLPDSPRLVNGASPRLANSAGSGQSP